MKEKIALLIVLYNDLPKKYIWEIIDTPIIIVDNSYKRDLKLSKNNVKYIPLYKNYGIAKALNVGFDEAKKIGAEWVLTMDQDSDYPIGMIEAYQYFVNQHIGKIGLLCPLINNYLGENRMRNQSFIEVDEALTSGSFINMKAYEISGGFKEELFIDAVDFEFCYNIKSKGYNIYMLNWVVMQHKLGNTKEIKLFGKHLFYVTHHNYIRHYYMQRNGLYVSQLYSKNSIISIISYLKPIFKIILFEKDKIKKIKARYYGWLDYKNNSLGELNRKI